MKSSLFLTLVSAIIFTGPTMADYADSLGDLPALACPAGSRSLTPDIFGLESLEKAPALANVSATMPVVDRLVKLGNGLGLRLEVCFGADDKAELMRVASRINSVSPYEIYTAGTDHFFKVEGLDEAVFDSPAKLNIVVRFKDSTKGLLIRGSESQTPSFVVGASIAIKDTGRPDQWQHTSLYAIVGHLSYGDFMGQGPCNKAGSWDGSSSVQLGTAKLTFNYCSFLGGGETTGHDIYKISITDSNMKLKPEHRGHELVLEGETLKKSLRYKWNHHNACDSFVLDIPTWQAQYSATSAPAAGCGTQVEGAPIRSYQDPEDIQRKTLFRTSYQGQAGELQLLDQGHFMDNQ